MESGIGPGYECPSSMRQTVKLSGISTFDRRSVSLGNSKAFIQRKRYNGYLTETRILPSTSRRPLSVERLLC